MEIPDELYCVFSAHVDERDDSYVLEVPAREVTIGDLDAGDTYRIALFSTASEADELTAESTPSEATATSNPNPNPNTPSSSYSGSRRRYSSGPSPPVVEGETRTVEIKDIGEQGDGVARVENGYVIIVPDTELRERVTIEVTDVKQNVAFATVLERREYYE